MNENSGNYGILSDVGATAGTYGAGSGGAGQGAPVTSLTSAENAVNNNGSGDSSRRSEKATVGANGINRLQSGLPLQSLESLGSALGAVVGLETVQDRAVRLESRISYLEEEEGLCLQSLASIQSSIETVQSAVNYENATALELAKSTLSHAMTNIGVILKSLRDSHLQSVRSCRAALTEVRSCLEAHDTEEDLRHFVQVVTRSADSPLPEDRAMAQELPPESAFAATKSEVILRERTSEKSASLTSLSASNGSRLVTTNGSGPGNTTDRVGAATEPLPQQVQQPSSTQSPPPPDRSSETAGSGRPDTPIRTPLCNHAELKESSWSGPGDSVSVAFPIGSEYPSVPQSKSPSASQPHDTVSSVSRAAVEIVSCAAPTSASVSEVPQSPTGQEGNNVHGEVEHGTPEAGSADDESASDDQEEDDDDEEFVVRWNRIRREGSIASDTVVESVTHGPDEVDVGESFPRPERASDLSTGPESANNTISRGRSLTLPSPSPRPRAVSPTIMKNRRSSVQFTPRYGLEADGHHPLIANEMQSSLASESAEDPDSHLRSDLSASEDLPEPPTLPPSAAERASSPKSVDTLPHP
eukprot:gene6900-8828_t